MNEEIPINSAVSYFRDCYRLDTRTTQLTNFFGRKVEQRLILVGKESLLTNELHYLPIPNESGSKIEKTLNVYSKEKALYYCSLFIIGFGVNSLGKQERVCAPLFMYEADISKNEDGYSITIDKSQRLINIDSINHLRKEEGEIRTLINNRITTNEFGFESITGLRELLNTAYNSLNTEELLLYPKLYSEKEIKKCYSHQGIKNGVFQIVPASGIALIRRSENTQGIMTELKEMSEMNDGFPDVIKSLFNASVSAFSSGSQLGFVPALLNNAQQNIISNSRKHRLSVVIGPPGTGKSFTIAALAIEFLSRGKSVLVVSKTDQAVDVIENKIKNDLNISNATVRAGKKGYLRKLKTAIEDLLNGLKYYRDTEFVQQNKDRVKELKESIENCYEVSRRSSKAYDKLLTDEENWGETLSSQPSSMFGKLKISYLYWLNKLKSPHWVTTADFMKAQVSRVELVREYVSLNFQRRIKLMLLNERIVLKKFLSAIKARSSSAREERFSKLNFNILFNAFPIWLCKLSDLHKVLPFKKELFDLVVIDEATQSDIASALPAIYRGKSAVIVGDPKQLRHVSFLSGAIQDSLLNKYGIDNHTSVLDYRNTSILDFADNALRSQVQSTLLNEHYRSLPKLIRFSNEQFYNGALKMMNVIKEDSSDDPIEHYNVNGFRSPQGVNEIEAERIIEYVSNIVEEDEIVDAAICRSIGLLSPFRNQVDHLNLLIIEHFEPEVISKHKILCGTAYSFQGEERDTMLISFCLDNNSHSSGFIHFNKPDVFNVTITRAKSKVRLFTSFDISKLAANSYLRLYLEMIDHELHTESIADKPHDEFLIEVRSELDNKGYRTKVCHEVADLSLDMVVFNDKDQLIAIDLIGYPGHFEEGLALTAYKVLHRTNIPTFPLPYSFWKFEKERCLAALEQFIESNTEVPDVY